MLIAAIGLVAIAIVARPWLERHIKDRPRFQYSRQPLSSEAYARLGAQPGWSPISLAVSDGATLKGLIRRPTEPSTAQWLVFFPGNDKTQLATGQRLLDYVRADKDYGLLTFAYRGFDASSGTTSVAALQADGPRIMQVLTKDERVDPARIHLVAFSMGGFVACTVASAAASAGKRLASLSLLASIGNAELNSSELAARTSIGDVYEVLPLLPGVPGPVLVLHGTADDALPLTTGREIARRLGERATLVEIPGGPHDLTTSHAALDQVRAMVQRSTTPTAELRPPSR